MEATIQANGVHPVNSRRSIELADAGCCAGSDGAVASATTMEIEMWKRVCGADGLSISTVEIGIDISLLSNRCDARPNSREPAELTACITIGYGSAPGVTRTPGQRFRKPLLYPPELRGHLSESRIDAFQSKAADSRVNLLAIGFF